MHDLLLEKQARLVRRSTVLRFPVQSVFPGLTVVNDINKHIYIYDGNRNKHEHFCIQGLNYKKFTILVV
jgi:hypothetical protein